MRHVIRSRFGIAFPMRAATFIPTLFIAQAPLQMGEPRFEKFDAIDDDGDGLADRIRHQMMIEVDTADIAAAIRFRVHDLRRNADDGDVGRRVLDHDRIGADPVPWPIVMGPDIFAPAPTTTPCSSVG